MVLTSNSAVDTGVYSNFVVQHSYTVGYPPGIPAAEPDNAPDLRITFNGSGTALNENSPRDSDCAPRTIPSDNSPRFMPLKMYRAAGGIKLSLFVGSF